MVRTAVNDDYIALFNAFIAENSIVEYYRLDPYGSYLGLDKNGQTSWLIIRPEDSFIEALNIAHYANQTDVAALLQNKTKLLFLFSEFEKKLPVEKWQPYLFPVSHCFTIRDKPHYASIIKRQNFGLATDSITHFASYLPKAYSYSDATQLQHSSN